MANEIMKGCASHHLALIATDLKKSVEMYKAIGFKETLPFENGTFLDIGDGLTLEIFQGSTSFPAGGWVHFSMLVDDVEAALQVALDAGFTVCSPLTRATISSDPPRNVINAFVRGNDNEVLEFMKFID